MFAERYFGDIRIQNWLQPKVDYQFILFENIFSLQPGDAIIRFFNRKYRQTVEDPASIYW